MRVLIAGGTGLIGRALTVVLEASGHEVGVLTRKPSRNGHIYWKPEAGECDLEAGDRWDALVNLAGENIASGLWTAARMRRIRDSRIAATRTLSRWCADQA